MTLIELHEKIKNPANTQLLLLVTGLTLAEFLVLEQKFIADKHGDQTVKLKCEKITAAILAVRFKLDKDAIKSVLLPNATMATVTGFMQKVIPRLTNILTAEQGLSNKLKTHSLIAPSSILPAKFDDLDELIERLQDANVHKVLVTKKNRVINDGWLKEYLLKPVAIKSKVGQDNFLQLLTCFVFDYEEFKTLDDYLVWYMCVVIGVNMHCASYAPRTGYGMVQKREAMHPAYYIRSQSAHPDNLHNKSLTAKDARSQCLSPKNEVLFSTIKREVKTKFVSTLSKYDELGFVKADKKGTDKFSYFSLQFAASGLRVNNFQAKLIAVNHHLSKIKSSLLTFMTNNTRELYLQSLFKDPMVKRKREKIQQLLTFAYQQHNALIKKCDGMTFTPNLNEQLMTYRINSAKKIVKEFKKLNCAKIALKWVPGSSIVEVTFYPTDNIPDIANNANGVTNVIISFFVGLLNYKLSTEKLHIHTYRRQSFAFNRFSVAHISNMLMRISMGYEPDAFLDVLKDTFKILDDLLTRFPFYDATTPLLKKGFEVVENRDCAEEKKGNHFLNFSRSETNLLRAVDMADNALSAFAEDDDGIDKAYESYIGFITKDVEFIMADGEHFGLNDEEARSVKDNILVVGLLNNTFLYAMQLLDHCQTIDFKESPLLYSYYFNVAKIMKYACKAHALLIDHLNLPASHVYAKALLLIDGMLEHLTLVRTILISIDKDKEISKKKLAILTDSEKKYAAAKIPVPLERIDVFFADNGEQTFTIALFNLGMQVINRKAIAGLGMRVSAFRECYFELFNNLNENFDLTICKKVEDADFIFVDIRELNRIACIFSASQKPAVKIIVIDCTHNPYYVDSNISDVVRDLLRKDIFVVINGSMLKHEQLGQDKFQAGKLIVFSPAGMSLNENVREELNDISKAAMHPVIADYFIMINDICQDKVGTLDLNKNSLFKLKVVTPAKEIPAPKAAL